MRRISFKIRGQLIFTHTFAYINVVHRKTEIYTELFLYVRMERHFPILNFLSSYFRVFSCDEATF